MIEKLVIAFISMFIGVVLGWAFRVLHEVKEKVEKGDKDER